MFYLLRITLFNVSFVQESVCLMGGGGGADLAVVSSRSLNHIDTLLIHLHVTDRFLPPERFIDCSHVV